MSAQEKLFGDVQEPKRYFRVMLGRGSEHAHACLSGNFIGADFGIHENLSGKLPDEWRKFNRKYIPVFLANRPDRTRIGAGLACGALWTVSKGIRKDDAVLCPDGTGTYRVGQVVSDYYYTEGEILPHRRKVRWLDATIPRTAMSEELRRSCGSIGTVSTISVHREEIERLLATLPTMTAPIPAPSEIEDPEAFAMEQHLEDFLVKNWPRTSLGEEFDIYKEDGELVGQQYQTDTGPLDILAISKDKKRLLVVELKRGRASDVVVGQIARYIGYIKDVIAAKGQSVEGAIIALEDDIRLRRALAAVPNVSFYRYKISFKLVGN